MRIPLSVKIENKVAGGPAAEGEVMDSFAMLAKLNGPQRALVGHPGVAVAVVALPRPGRDLVVFADMGALNEGAAADRVIDLVQAQVLSRMNRTGAGGVQSAELRWVLIDVAGVVDEIVQNAEGEHVRVGLKGPGSLPARSVQALSEIAGGHVGLQQLRSVQHRYERLARVTGATVALR